MVKEKVGGSGVAEFGSQAMWLGCPSGIWAMREVKLLLQAVWQNKDEKLCPAL